MWVSREEKIGPVTQELRTRENAIDIAPPFAAEELVKAQVLFEKQGHVSGTTTFGHLYFDLDLQKVDDYINEVNRLIVGNGTKWFSKWNHKIYGDYEASSLKNATRKLELDWAETKCLFTGEGHLLKSVDRGPRAIHLAIGALLGLVGVGLASYAIYTHVEMQRVFQAVDQLDEQQQYILQRIQNFDALLESETISLQDVDNDVAKLREYAYQNSNNAFYHHATEAIFRVLRRTARIVDDTREGLFSLLHGHVSNQLVPMAAMEKALADLAKIAEAHSFKSPISHPGYAYQLPTSFETHGTVIRVLIHVPLIRGEDILTLYNFHNLPLALTGSNQVVQVDAQEEILAINQDNTEYLALKPSDLTDCITLSTLKICPNLNYRRRDFEASCIASLFVSRAEAAHKACPMAFVPHRAEIKQLAQGQFLVFHPENMRLQVKCTERNYRKMIQFRGTRLVHLDPGCYGHSTAYSMEAHKEFTVNHTILRAETEWAETQLLPDVTPEQLKEIMPAPPTRRVPVQQVLGKIREYRAQARSWHHSWVTSLSSATVGLVIACVVIAVAGYYLRGRILRAFRAFTGPSYHPVVTQRPRQLYPEFDDPPRYSSETEPMKMVRLNRQNPDSLGIIKSPGPGRRSRAQSPFDTLTRYGVDAMASAEGAASHSWQEEYEPKPAARPRPIIYPRTHRRHHSEVETSSF